MNPGIEVLLVDDSPADLDLTREGLSRSRQQFQVSAVADGAEAICFLRRQGKYAQAPEPDLILLDLNLPRKDGREVLSELKNDPQFTRIPVVIFTTSQATSDVNVAMRTARTALSVSRETFPSMRRRCNSWRISG